MRWMKRKGIWCVLWWFLWGGQLSCHKGEQGSSGAKNQAGQKSNSSQGKATKAARKAQTKAITAVQQAKTKKGAMLKHFLVHYVKVTNQYLRKKGSAVIQGMNWSATCAGNRCQVSLQYRTGKVSSSAWWLVRGKSVEPLNKLARCLMQRC